MKKNLSIMSETAFTAMSELILQGFEIFLKETGN